MKKKAKEPTKFKNATRPAAGRRGRKPRTSARSKVPAKAQDEEE
jgi:hypothetical protein